MLMLSIISTILWLSATQAPSSVKGAGLGQKCEWTYECFADQVCGVDPRGRKKSKPGEKRMKSSEPGRLHSLEHRDGDTSRASAAEVRSNEFKIPEKEVVKKCIRRPVGTPLHFFNRQCEKLSDCPGTYRCDIAQQTCFSDLNKPLHWEGRTCQKDYQCPGTFTCDTKAKACMLVVGRPLHIENRKCEHDHNCPGTYKCDKANETCYSRPKEPVHLEGIHCQYHYHCPIKFQCRDGTCYFKADLRTHFPKQRCTPNLECPLLYECDLDENTCYFAS